MNKTQITPTIHGNDAPRTRRSDPATSHAAADRSQSAVKPTKLAVLKLIHQEFSLSGEEINDLYALRSERHDWPTAKYDTPRKRAGELFDDGLLELDDREDTGRVFRLSAAGAFVIGVAA